MFLELSKNNLPLLQLLLLRVAQGVQTVYINYRMRVREYKSVLDDWKLLVLYFEIAVVIVRFISLIGSSLQLVLQITQLAAAAIIYRRPLCSSEAKYFVVVSVLLSYFLVFNFLYCFFQANSQKQTLIVEHFKNGYQTWGYSMEFLFRIFSCVVIWRAYQLALILEETEDQGLLNQIQ